MNKTYFLGSNTPTGFYSLFNELYNPYDDWNLYIIKGGPGTGKSTLMNNIADEALKYNYSVDYILCSSDPRSLDGIIIPELKTSICDGTSPHVVEPVFPGICEHIINLCECWDESKLNENKSKIKIISMTNKKAHQKCIKYLKTAKIFDDELDRIIYPSIRFDKIQRFIERIPELKNKEIKDSFIKNRLISTITPAGITVNYDTILNECESLIILKDNYNISKYILNSIINKNSFNIIKYMCPLDPVIKTEHMVFTDLKFGIFTSNKYHSISDNKFKTVSTSRFINTNELKENKNSIIYLNKCKNEMINEAINSLKAAKTAHDILESYYISAMNYDKVNNIKESLIKKIFT